MQNIKNLSAMWTPSGQLIAIKRRQGIIKNVWLFVFDYDNYHKGWKAI